MFLIYRTWLLVRIIERLLPDSEDRPFPQSGQVMTLLLNTKSVFGKKYGLRKAIKAKMFAEACGYVKLYENKDGSDLIEVTGKGFIFAEYSGLVNKQVQTFSWVLQLVAIIISLIALHYSIK